MFNDEFVTQLAEKIVSIMADRFPQVRTKRLYSVAEAAEYLGRTERAVYHLHYGGKLRAVSSGDKRVMFDVLDLDAFIEASKTHN